VSREQVARSTQLDGVFIDVELNESIVDDPELARKLEEVCPVDIFAEEDGHVAIVRSNLDECVLCGLCLDAAPDGTVRVKKLYDGTELVRRAAAA
jgi:NAD-dependent dihydropyrimidine dehydrogenase PreA subunit